LLSSEEEGHPQMWKGEKGGVRGHRFSDDESFDYEA
jgi:hypothetical protein